MRDIIEVSRLIGPDCPEHGELVLSLLLGDLEGHEARRIEPDSRSCEICKVWWETFEDSRELEEVETGVLAGLTTFTPTTQRSRLWIPELAIAASVVALAIGVPLVVSQLEPTGESAGLEVSTPTIVELGFESGTVATTEVISRNGFEDSGASSWRLDSD